MSRNCVTTLSDLSPWLFMSGIRNLCASVPLREKKIRRILLVIAIRISGMPLNTLIAHFYVALSLLPSQINMRVLQRIEAN